jgi:hypothetical protein
MGTTKVVWTVDDSRTFRDLSDQVAVEADVAIITMGIEELALRRTTHDLPDGIMLDGSALDTSNAEQMLAGVPRIVICTARNYANISTGWEQSSNVRILLKPMNLQKFESAILWLAGAEDSASWPTPHPN